MVQAGHLTPISDHYLTKPDQPSYVMAWRLEPKRELGVPVPGSYRFISDSRPINAATRPQTFRYPPLSDLGAHFRNDHWAVVQDVRNFFYAMPVHPRHQRYWVVRAPGPSDPTWNIDTPPPLDPLTSRPIYRPHQLFQFTCLPMGWSGSPYVMHKTVQFLVRRLQQRGVIVCWCVDDVLIVGPRHEVQLALAEFLRLMARLGMQVHPSKGFRTPRSRFIYLGIGIDLGRMEWFVPPHRQAILASRAARTRHHALTHARHVPARALARVAGTAISLRLPSPAIPHWARSLFDCLRAPATASFDPRRLWRQSCRLPKQALRDLEQLEHLPILWPRQPIRCGAPEAQVVTDASTRGCGGRLGDQDSVDWVAGYWTTQHVSGEINFLELEAARRVVQAFVNRLRGLRARILTDNTSVLQLLNNHSSRSQQLMAAYRPLFTFLAENNILLPARHIATTANVLADNLSRRADPQEFGISELLLHAAVRRWHRQPTIDLFASGEHHQPGLPYSTRWASAGGAHDAFLQPWVGVLWLTPPLALMNWVVPRLASSGATGYLLHPVWPGQPCWQSLMAIRTDFLEIDIQDYITINPNNPATPELLRDSRWAFQLPFVNGDPDSIDEL